jgi:hypothetical protein
LRVDATAENQFVTIPLDHRLNRHTQEVLFARLFRDRRLNLSPRAAHRYGIAKVKLHAAGEAILNATDIPTFKYPDRAARAFELMWHYDVSVAPMTATLFGEKIASSGLPRALRSTSWAGSVPQTNYPLKF